MAMSDHSPTKKQFVKIITCDPKTRRIEGQLKDLALIQIAIWDVPHAFRWPQEGEVWAVHNINGYWHLGNPVELESNKPIEDLEPGDSKVGAGPGTTVYVDGSLKTPGEHSYVAVDMETEPGGGVPYFFVDGWYWIDTNPYGRTVMGFQDQAALQNAASPPWVTSLPTTNLVDGMEISYLADSTNGIAWHLKYRAAESSSKKWYYIGGPPLLNVHTGMAWNPAPDTGAGNWTSGGASLTVPLAGDYQVEVVAEHYFSLGASTVYCYADLLSQIAYGGTRETGTGVYSALEYDTIDSDYIGHSVTGSDVHRKNGVAANTTLTIHHIWDKYGSTVAVDPQVGSTQIIATPIRVG